MVPITVHCQLQLPPCFITAEHEVHGLLVLQLATVNALPDVIVVQNVNIHLNQVPHLDIHVGRDHIINHPRLVILHFSSPVSSNNTLKLRLRVVDAPQAQVAVHHVEGLPHQNGRLLSDCGRIRITVRSDDPTLPHRPRRGGRLRPPALGWALRRLAPCCVAVAGIPHPLALVEHIPLVRHEGVQVSLRRRLMPVLVLPDGDMRPRKPQGVPSFKRLTSGNLSCLDLHNKAPPRVHDPIRTLSRLGAPVGHPRRGPPRIVGLHMGSEPVPHGLELLERISGSHLGEWNEILSVLAPCTLENSNQEARAGPHKVPPLVSPRRGVCAVHPDHQQVQVLTQPVVLRLHLVPPVLALPQSVQALGVLQHDTLFPGFHLLMQEVTHVLGRCQIPLLNHFKPLRNRVDHLLQELPPSAKARADQIVFLTVRPDVKQNVEGHKTKLPAAALFLRNGAIVAEANKILGHHIPSQHLPVQHTLAPAK
mmetsp:Transcript_116176/g.266675  ORF Transcript_116176/g.266675 Transcript_116176/m.266675 type:complete len:478 (-) Transcript_116176:951-2384(-)